MVQAEILLTNQAQKDQVQKAWKTPVGENAPCGGFLYQSLSLIHLFALNCRNLCREYYDLMDNRSAYVNKLSLIHI